ncbi:hypothetical protein PIB30_051219 [Stylosanthes scabra]|uniref:Uncharacterized protein n=1 Tax=Stylosanthes scabra TaxID=79078 RepID=A0ABU6SHX5_9FABA|nr:hypothetical protein [Stylosanthes scabra]
MFPSLHHHDPTFPPPVNLIHPPLRLHLHVDSILISRTPTSPQLLLFTNASISSIAHSLYDGEIIRAQDGSVIFSSSNPMFAYLSNEVRCLCSLKKLFSDVTGQEGKTYEKVLSLRTDEEVDLAIYWHIHHPDIHLLEPFAILIDVAERSLSSNATNNTQSTDPTRGGSMEDDVESHQRAAAVEHPMAEPFFVDHVLSDEEINPIVLSEAEAAEMNYFTGSSIAFTKPTISERYDCRTHLSLLNLDAMNEHVSPGQRAPDDDPTTEFEVGLEFQNKKVVLIVVKTYNINRGVDYKILESD